MSPFVRATLIGASLLLLCSVGIRAQPPAAAPPTATAADWPKLLEERDARLAQLQEIQQQLQTAEGAEAEQLRAEARKLLDAVFSDLFPRMRAAALDLLQRDTLDPETVGEIVQLAYRTFQENKFAEAAALAEGVVAKDPDNANALNLAGVCHFALHDFSGAAEILNQAQQKELLTQLGAQYIESAEKYIDYWKEEQALRQKERAAPPERQLPLVELTTTRGKVIVELFEDQAPNTVANFVSLVEQGFYDGTKFHRVLPAFMAQGGDPNTRDGAEGQPGTGGPGYTIPCEWDSPQARRHFAGSLSMAHAGRNTGGSQFFLTHLPTPHLNRDEALAAGRDAHTVFGRVVEGMDVVLALKVGDEINSAKVLRKRNHEYKPKTLPAAE